MSYLRYLYTRLLPICLFGMADVGLGAFLYLTGAPGHSVLWATLSALLLGVAGLTAGYLLKRSRERRLRSLSEGLDRKELLGEVLPKPPDSEERVYYDAMKTVSRAALTVAADAQKEAEEYRAFIEQWLHELKTPLTAMHLIIENGGDAAKLRRELERADNLTEEVLFYARSTSPDRDLVIREVDLVETMRQAVAGVKNVLIGSAIKLKVEGEGSAQTDPKWLCFIVRQLLLNCAQYTPAGGEVTVTVDAGGIAVTDTGIGIPPEDLPRVTERGFTGTNGRERGRSTGMGLYIVDKLCSHLGLTLAIASKPGEGTRVTLKFGHYENVIKA